MDSMKLTKPANQTAHVCFIYELNMKVMQSKVHTMNSGVILDLPQHYEDNVAP